MHFQRNPMSPANRVVNAANTGIGTGTPQAGPSLCCCHVERGETSSGDALNSVAIATKIIMILTLQVRMTTLVFSGASAFIGTQPDCHRDLADSSERTSIWGTRCDSHAQIDNPVC